MIIEMMMIIIMTINAPAETVASAKARAFTRKRLQQEACGTDLLQTEAPASAPTLAAATTLSRKACHKALIKEMLMISLNEEMLVSRPQVRITLENMQTLSFETFCSIKLKNARPHGDHFRRS